MFDGCFCDEEFKSFIQQELNESDSIYYDMLEEAKSNYHEKYGYEGYPSEEERNNCEDLLAGPGGK
jgi:hypothetical protein